MNGRTIALTGALWCAVGCVLAGCPAENDTGTPDVVEGEGGKWEKLTPLPSARQEIAVVCLRGEVVVIGGFTDDGLTNEVLAYDPSGDAWRALADLPEPIHHANAAVVSDRYVVIAGFLVGGDFEPRGDVLVYDAESNAWSNGTPMPGNEIRGASGVAALDDEGSPSVIVAGGLRGDSAAEISRYAVGTQSWSDLGALPEPLDHLAGAAIEGRVYLVGGRTNGVANHTSTLFELAGITLTQRASMPTRRGGFAAAALDGVLYVMGGEGSADDPDGVFPELEAYDPNADAWRSLVGMRTPRHGMGACALDGAVYVPGGATAEGFGAVDVVERFVPSSSDD